MSDIVTTLVGMVNDNTMLTFKESENDNNCITLRFCKEAAFEDGEKRLIYKEYDILKLAFSSMSTDFPEVLYSHYLDFTMFYSKIVTEKIRKRKD